MRIGELARRTGVSERSLRYYEQQGLLLADRTPGGQRKYGESAFDRVIRIQELFAAGLHSKKIALLLPCMRDVDGGPSQVATTKLVADLVVERDRIDRMIVDLANSRGVLDDVIDTASATFCVGGNEAVRETNSVQPSGVRYRKPSSAEPVDRRRAHSK